MKKQNYPSWKIELIEKFIPDFSWDYNNEKMFERFIYYANIYKKRCGHINIKFDDVIDGYNIGTKLNHLNSENISMDKIERLNEIGIFIGNRLQRRFDKKMELAWKAVKEGIVIRKTNPNYRGENLYNWITRTVKVKYQNDELTKEQVTILEKLIDKPLDNLFKGSL